MTETSGSGPLDGVRVIDLSAVVMGPYAARTLGDLGADVIKIESPSDTVRVGRYRVTPGMTALNLNVNRNKCSIALNLKDPDQRDKAVRLVDTADVLITNMRPAALQGLGMTYADVAPRNPRLVYAHAQGFRADSDRAGDAACDETVQAASGLVDITQRPTPPGCGRSWPGAGRSSAATANGKRQTANGNGIVLDYEVARYFADAEALYSYGGAREMNTLIVGKSITGQSAFV